MKDLSFFLEHTDKFESLYTILVYNIKLRNIIDYIETILHP